MELSRDVERALLSCPVWPLEGVKFDYLLEVTYREEGYDVVNVCFVPGAAFWTRPLYTRQ